MVKDIHLTAPRPRLERGTYCLGGIPETRLGISPCGLTCRSAVAAMAGRGPMRPGVWGCWLPVWLPPRNIVSSANVRMFWNGRQPKRPTPAAASHSPARPPRRSSRPPAGAPRDGKRLSDGPGRHPTALLAPLATPESPTADGALLLTSLTICVSSAPLHPANVAAWGLADRTVPRGPAEAEPGSGTSWPAS